jgi:hypothetical protein
MKKTKSPASQPDITLLTMHRFNNIQEISDDCYNVPGNHAVLDALWPSGEEIYQVTSAESHGIHSIHLQTFKKAFNTWLKSNSTVKFIFIVPPNRFDGYTKQRYLALSKEDGDSQDQSYDFSRVQQYVLEMDASPLKDSLLASQLKAEKGTEEDAENDTLPFLKKLRSFRKMKEQSKGL